MRFGICGGLDEAPKILDAGFDYVELPAVGFQGLEQEWDPAPYQGLPVEVTNLFFPGEIKLFGDEPERYLGYARTTVDRASEIGVKVMVIGSGGSRKAPAGSRKDSDFARIAAEIAQHAQVKGIAIAPESLNRSETNVGNDLRSLALVLKEEGCGYTADSYHVLYEWDADGRRGSMEDLWASQLPHTPTHVHIATLEGRAAPMPDDPLLQGFVRRLKDLGYDSRISLECARGESFNLSQARENLAVLWG